MDWAVKPLFTVKLPFLRGRRESLVCIYTSWSVLGKAHHYLALKRSSGWPLVRIGQVAASLALRAFGVTDAAASGHRGGVDPLKRGEGRAGIGA
jgi:hypothetical protein